MFKQSVGLFLLFCTTYKAAETRVMYFSIFVLQLDQDKNRVLSSSSGYCWVSAGLWSVSFFSQETEGEFSKTEKIQYIKH